MHTQPLDVRHGSEIVSERREPRIAQRQRIAAAQDDLLERGVARDLPQRFVETRPVAHLLGVRELAPEAVATMNGTGRDRDEERPSLVFLQEARGSACGGLAKWIGGIARCGGALRGEG